MKNNLQRGYNIVEMLISLVVLGFLVGGALIPLQRYYERANDQEALELLAQAKNAVAVYAVHHASIERVLEDHGAFDEVVLPSGRPYLPCPDINNDGLEDRNPGAGALNLALTVQGTLLVTLGVCTESKGGLPWKTLGLEEVDPWGNRLTYLVDEGFSSALLGFDQHTRADIFDVRASLTYDTTFILDGRYQLRASDEVRGAVICDIRGGIAVTLQMEDCANLYNLQAGVVIQENITLTVGARVFDVSQDPRGVVEGVPFVILSHGPNGYGAINRQGRCRHLSTGNFAEQENAYLRTNHPLVASGDCSQNDIAGGLHSRFYNTIRSREGLAFDDLLVWMSANELAGFLLRHDVFPVEEPAFLRQ